MIAAGGPVRGFVGRGNELDDLGRTLAKVVSNMGGREPGVCLQVRGRRRVGKPGLAEEFSSRYGLPTVSVTAEGRGAAGELRSFWDAARASGATDEAITSFASPDGWSAAFRLLAAALPHGRPTTVVLDELPYLVGSVPAFEGSCSGRGTGG